MTVRKISLNLDTANPEQTSAFYADLFDLTSAMNHGWIVTLQSQARQSPQISFASEGGSGTPVPLVSIEVEDVDAICERARDQGLAIEYGPVTEDWGVRRFYVRDPAGNLLNILSHAAPAGAP